MPKPNAPVPKSKGGTETGDKRRFLSGVVEGFYGRPWTMEQRTELFRREQKWGLNTYLYAPKDDYKHRMYWRDLYSPQEAEQLKALIASATERQVEFIYAISPGLDITFSNPRELKTLQRKLDQVSGFGCRSFALLFDDIESEMCPADRKAFGSFADAHVSVTNAVFRHLGEPDTFLFCPTDYCAVFCTPSVLQSSYLHTVGEKLLPGVDVLWTGPKVVSQEISVESIEEVSCVLKRPPVIWDNIHANDYDPQRLFLGPYKHRPTELIPKLRGVLTNPNCEFEPNFVAIHTLATWCHSSGGGASRDVDMTGDEDQGGDYNPQHALRLALTDWLVEFGVTEQQGCPSSEEPMQTDPEGVYVPGPGENPLYTAEPLTLEDLFLLSELFYLPYEHGLTGASMLQQLHWLRDNQDAAVFGAAATERRSAQAAEWRSRAERFDEMCDAVVQMFNRLSNAPNRSILYDLYNYICDIKSGVGLARSYVKTLGGQSPPSAQLMSGDPEPWGFRGGLSGEFQRMLPCHGNRDLFRRPLSTVVYSIRPYCPQDQAEAYRILKEMQQGMGGALVSKQPELLGDRLATGEAPPSPDCSLVLEDEVGVCGYALGLPDAKQAVDSSQRSVPDLLLRDFPSLISVQLLPKVTDPAVARRLIGRLLSLLKTSGSPGAFCELGRSDARMMDFFRELGSFRTLTVEGAAPEVVTMATTL